MKHNFSYYDGILEMRPMSYADSEQYRQLRNLDNNRKRFFYSNKISASDQKTWYENYLKDETDYMFAFYYNGQFAGGNAIYHIDFKKRVGEYGRLLVNKQSFPIKGLGSAITYATAQIAANSLGLQMLYAEIYEDNMPSYYACLHAGFHFVELRATENNKKIYYIENTLHV